MHERTAAMNVGHVLTSLTPVAACGIAVICCVAGVFGAQLAARAWRQADDAAPKADDRDYVRVHAEARIGRARARAEAAQLSSSAFLVTSACVAVYAIAPGLPAEGLGALALAGCAYLVVDAVLSCVAETRSIDDDEAYDVFEERSPEGPGPNTWRAFAESHPKAAHRILRRHPRAAEGFRQQESA